MKYTEAIDYLNSFTKSGKPVTDLSRFKALMKQLGDPQNHTKYIHVAGTNGKGSICEYTALGLQYSGFSTGKFTSPFINKIEERIQLNNQSISQEDFALYISEVKNAAEKTGCPYYSQFELLNAAAFLYYKDKGCDYAVLEAGIGGLLDSTNIVDPVISVITTIDLDHCAILGDTPEKIAVHKAGIIKNNRPCIISPYQKKGVINIFKEKAEETQSPLIIPDEKDIKLINADLSGTKFSYKGKIFKTKMCGKHQAVNGTAAIEALRLLDINEQAIEKALAEAAVPARMEKIGSWLIDGAHNPSGAEAAASLIGEIRCSKTLVTGMLTTKDWETALTRLIPCFDHIVAVDFFAGEAVKKEEIKTLAEKLGKSCLTASSAEEAVRLGEQLGDDLKMVCGSLYLCGIMRNCL